MSFMMSSNAIPLGAPVAWPALTEYRKHPACDILQAGSLGYFGLLQSTASILLAICSSWKFTRRRRRHRRPGLEVLFSNFFNTIFNIPTGYNVYRKMNKNLYDLFGVAQLVTVCAINVWCRRHQSRSGTSPLGISNWIDLACPGILLMNPFFSRVSIIWCTDGGDTLKYLSISYSAGALPFSFM